MSTNLDLDDRLILEVKKAGNHKTKKEAVTAALREYLAHRRRLDVLGAFGEVDFAADYDYKKARSR
jgi:Arc/MetJ family transcription regulator